MDANVYYKQETSLTAQDFQDILIRSTLSERRPYTDIDRLEKMISNANLIVTARFQKQFVGIARSITDFSYCCYLSDLAVDKKFQKMGIGKNLIGETHKIAGLDTNLILLSAPDAKEYYPKLGMTLIDNGFIIKKKN